MAEAAGESHLQTVAISIQATNITLENGEQVVLVKLFQGWKLHSFCYHLCESGWPKPDEPRSLASVTREILLTKMALLSIAMNRSHMGSSEVNKALEVELG